MSSTIEKQLSNQTIKSSSVFSKLMDQEDTTLEDILNDDDFLSEMKMQNENLMGYLDYNRVSQMIDILLTEPSISSSSIKSFKIPFIICEVLCMDLRHLNDKVLDPDTKYELFIKLLTYFTQDRAKLEDGRLNQTLSSYVAKIVTFMCLKRPEAVLDCVGSNTGIIAALFDHVYLTECISDMLVKFICLRVHETESNLQTLEAIQSQILTMIVRLLDVKDIEAEKLDQTIETIKGMSRRCYLVTNKQRFFQHWFEPEYLEETMGESFYDRLLKFIFESQTEHTYCVIKLIDVVQTVTNNLFISTPAESAQDVSEYQFGFSVESIAGIAVEEAKEDANGDANMKEDNKKEKEKKAPDENESKVLEQDNNKKKSVLENQRNIFALEEGKTKVVDTFMKYFPKLCSFFENASPSSLLTTPFSVHRKSTSMSSSGLRSMLTVKYKNQPTERLTIAKLVSWLHILLTFQSEELLNEIKESDILKSIVGLCELYDDHSLIQAEARKLFTTIINSDDITMKQKLLNDGRCIFLFAKKLNMVDFTNLHSITKSRKCIYTTIKHTIEVLMKNMDIRMECLLEDMQVNWSIIKSALEKDSKEISDANTNPKEHVEGSFKDSKHVETDNVVKHQQRKDIAEIGGSSVNIVKKSLDTRKRLVGLESF